MGATLPVAAESAPPPKPPENLNSPQRSYATVARAPSGLTLLKSCVDDPSLQIQNRRIQPKKIEIYKGKRSIFIPDDEIRVLLQPFKLALVGKFSHGCPKLHGLAQGFRSLGLRGKYSIGHLDPKHVLITCTVEEDYSLLWLRRDWKIWGFPMRVLKWTKSFKIEEESPIVPVWITIPMPPAYLLSKDILIEIAKMIGKPLRIDESTACRTKPGIARICVELNLLEKLQDSVVVRMSDEEVLLKIAYEKLPKYCTVCRHLGHEQNMCLLNGNEHNEKLGPVTGVNRKEKGAGKVMEAGKEQAIAVEHQVFDKMPQREQNKGALESAQEPRVTTPKTATNPATNISPRSVYEPSNRFEVLTCLVENKNDLNSGTFVIDAENWNSKDVDVEENNSVLNLGQKDNEFVLEVVHGNLALDTHFKESSFVGDVICEQNDVAANDGYEGVIDVNTNIQKSNVDVLDCDQIAKEVSTNDGNEYVGGYFNLDEGGGNLNMDEGDEVSQNINVGVVVEEEEIEEGEMVAMVNSNNQQIVVHDSTILGTEQGKEMVAISNSTDDVFRDIIDSRGECSDSECQRHIDFDSIDNIIINDTIDDRGMQSDFECLKKSRRVSPSRKDKKIQHGIDYVNAFGDDESGGTVRKETKEALKSVDDKKIGKRKVAPKADKRKAKKEKNAKKDPNKPKRPPSAFFVFLEEFRKTFKQENPNIKVVSAVGKASGEKWKSLTAAEKAPYEAKAATRKAAYEKLMIAYTDECDEGSERSRFEVHGDNEDAQNEERETQFSVL